MAQQNNTYPTFRGRDRSNLGDLYGDKQSTFDDRERNRLNTFLARAAMAGMASRSPFGRNQQTFDRLMAKARQSYDSYYDNPTSSFDR